MSSKKVVELPPELHYLLRRHSIFHERWRGYTRIKVQVAVYGRLNDRRSQGTALTSRHRRHNEAAEEAVIVPLRAIGFVRNLDRKRLHDVLELACSREIDRLVQVVGRGVVALGQPLLLRCRFGRARRKAHLHCRRGNSLADEAVLIATNESVA